MMPNDAISNQRFDTVWMRNISEPLKSGYPIRKRTLHFIYSAGRYSIQDATPPLASPYTITYYLGNTLQRWADRNGYAFRFQNLDDPAPVLYGEQDIVIGHPWFAVPNAPANVAMDANIALRVLLHPFTTKMTDEPAALTTLWRKADRVFVICGQYWFDELERHEHYRLYTDRVTRLDMAIDTEMHKRRKIRWNAAGDRGILLLGNTEHYKGNDRALRLAMATGYRVGYAGYIPNPQQFFPPAFEGTYYGSVEMNEAMQIHLAQEYDFFINLGRFDANPTTLLEAAAWGLISCCNKESGYYDARPFVGLEDDDMGVNLDILERLQRAHPDVLDTEAYAQLWIVRHRHNWTRFTSRVTDYLDEMLGSQTEGSDDSA